MFLLILVYPALASASFGIKLEGDRSSIIRDVRAGTSINEIIIIENPDAETVIDLFPVDQFKSVDGAYIPKSKYEQTSLFGEWIGPPVILTLAAKTAYAYAFTISVPKNVVNGTYYGAIMLQEVPKIAANGNVKITTSVGMRIKIMVTGGLTSGKMNTEKRSVSVITSVADVVPVVPTPAVQQVPQGLYSSPNSGSLNTGSPQAAPRAVVDSGVVAVNGEGENVLGAPVTAESSPSLTPIGILPREALSASYESVPYASLPVADMPKHDMWGILRIILLTGSLILVLFLIARKS